MMYDFLPSRASRKRDAARILRELQSFAAFDRWMDEQLDKLEAQWSHATAPNANRVVRFKGKAWRR
jgi:hypothetical protein